MYEVLPVAKVDDQMKQVKELMMYGLYLNKQTNMYTTTVMILPTDTWRNNKVSITSKRRFDVI